MGGEVRVTIRNDSIRCAIEQKDMLNIEIHDACSRDGVKAPSWPFCPDVGLSH